MGVITKGELKGLLIRSILKVLDCVYASSIALY